MRKFLKGGMFLAVCGLVSKAIGALFKVPLANVLGAEGMGMFQLAFPVYTVLLALSSGGFPQAISRLVSARISVGDEPSTQRVLKVGLISMGIVGGIGMLLLLVLGAPLAALQGNGGAAAGYWALSPSVLFVSLMSVFRGYFQGKRNMFPTAITQLTEQVVKLIFGLGLSILFLQFGLVSGVAGALLGISLSELIAFLISLIMYLAYRRRPTKRSRKQALAAGKSPNSGNLPDRSAKLPALGVETAADMDATVMPSLPASTASVRTERSFSANISNADILKEIYRAALPIALSSLVLPMSQLIDSVMVINLLRITGLAAAEATALYGIVTAPISVLVNLGTVFAGAFALSIIPALSTGNINAKISSHLRLTALLSAAAAALLFVFGDNVLALLYGGLGEGNLETASNLIRIMGISVFFLSMTMILAAALQGMGKAKIPAIMLCIGAAAKVALTAVLVLIMGISGSVIATVACYGLTFLLDSLYLRKQTGKFFAKEIFLPLGSAVAAGAIAWLVKLALPAASNWLILLLGGASFALIFLSLCFLTHSLKLKDLKGI